MTIWEWLAWADGKRIDRDGVYGAQCMDLINDALVRVWGVVPIPGNAVDVPRNRPGRGIWRPNSAVNVPEVGDIVAWAAGNHSIGTGPYGHTAVAAGGDSMHLLTMDQNWPTGSATHLVAHTYSGVLGWWHKG